MSLTAILDTNIFVRAAIRYPDSASSRVLDAYYDGKYHLLFSPGTRDELLDILLLPSIRARLDWSDDELLRFLNGILVHAFVYPGEVQVPPSVKRDVSDSKFLALATESGANYLVTKDNRHLLRLKRYQRTRILTPSQFLRELDTLS